MNPDEVSHSVRFGPYEANFRTQELRKHGVKLKLFGQPLQVLEVLVSRPGEMVSRAELEQLLWPGDVFVDANHGLNAAVNRLREALCDSASEPKYIETLPRRGYRFIATVERDSEQPAPLIESPHLHPPRLPETPQALHPTEVNVPPTGDSPRKATLRGTFATAAAIACAIGLAIFMELHFSQSPGPEISESNQLKVPEEALTRNRAANPISSGRLSTPTGADQENAQVHQDPQMRDPAQRRGVADMPPTRVNMKVDSVNDTNPLPAAFKFYPITDDDAGNAAPQFSPDGKHIAFMSTRSGNWQIWVSNIDGSQPRQVSFTDSAGTPRWSPDGRSIAFDAPFDSSTWIFEVRVDGQDQAEPIVQGLVPSFSRDGKWIYFASDRTGDWQVWKIPSLRGHEIRGSGVEVTFKGGFAALESTDGYLYYSKSRYPDPEICRVPVQGGEEFCGLSHLRPRTWASWAPTRGGIVFAEDLPNGQPVLSLYDPTRREVRDLVQLRSAPFWVGASIDGKRAMFNDAAERQISMVDNLH